MKTFSQFLPESTLGISQFPLLVSLGLNKRLDHLLTILNDALQAGSIANPTFLTAKSDISMIFDVITKKLGTDYFYNGQYESIPDKIYDLDLTLGNPGHVPGKMKKLEKLPDHPVKTAYLEYGRELSILLNTMEALKSKVVKRQPKSDDPTKSSTYIPPMAAHSAIAIVTGVLTKMTDELKKKYADAWFIRTVSDVEQRIENPISRQERIKLGFADPLYSIMQKVGDGYNTREGHYRKLLPNYESIIRKEVDQDAEDIQKQFLSKNVRKLAKIVELKGVLKGTPSILRLQASQAGFSGEVHMAFSDGSEFTVRNKVVVKRSIHGNLFLQFPTTFHDVKLGNGKHMPGQPSEKDMIEIFAGGTAADVPKEDGE